jgi:hypothetical protein
VDSAITLTRLICLAAALSASCGLEPAKEPDWDVLPSASSADDPSFRFPARHRLVAFGDVHGDLAAARTALRLAGAIDEHDDWIGGDLVVVQTGDFLDRGDDEPQIMALFDKLAVRAESAGGAFHSLNGNHEVMNVAGDFRFVTHDGFHDFESPSTDGANRWAASLEPEQRGRAASFLPGGPVAQRLAERPVIIVVGDTLFAHGGVLPAHVRHGIGRINDETRRWMRGEAAGMPSILSGSSAPIWSRHYSDGEPSERACQALSKVLDHLHVERMVVGHTVQDDAITSACDERVWRIDVGLGRFYGGRPAVLEIVGDELRTISP